MPVCQKEVNQKNLKKKVKKLLQVLQICFLIQKNVYGKRIHKNEKNLIMRAEYVTYEWRAELVLARRKLISALGAEFIFIFRGLLRSVPYGPGPRIPGKG